MTTSSALHPIDSNNWQWWRTELSTFSISSTHQITSTSSLSLYIYTYTCTISTSLYLD